MPLITRLANGSPLSTIQMDGNLDYLNTNMSGSNLTLSGSVEISGSLTTTSLPTTEPTTTGSIWISGSSATHPNSGYLMIFNP
jgi:hypothetical protein